MIVVDASAAVLGLTNDDEAREALAADVVVCPHLIDSEIAQAFRSLVLRREIDEAPARRAVEVWGQLGVERLAVHGLLPRIWDLRHNLSAYDATYVAMAEELGVPLLTADGRLGRAPGVQCVVSVVRR